MASDGGPPFTELAESAVPGTPRCLFALEVESIRIICSVHHRPLHVCVEELEQQLAEARTALAAARSR